MKKIMKTDTAWIPDSPLQNTDSKFCKTDRVYLYRLYICLYTKQTKLHPREDTNLRSAALIQTEVLQNSYPNAVNVSDEYLNLSRTGTTPKCNWFVSGPHQTSQ